MSGRFRSAEHVTMVAAVAATIVAIALAFCIELLMSRSADAQDQQRTIVPYAADGDAIVAPLDGAVGDAVRGRRIVLDRELGNCLVCHQVPEPAERFQGELGPNLGGVGRRLSVSQLRYRLVDASRLNAATIMPPYHRATGLARVAPRYTGRPILSSAEIEDVVAYLAGLQ